MYDVDLFETPRGTIDDLHAAGRAVVCYFSAGSWESWRPDAADFPDVVLGSRFVSGGSDTGRALWRRVITIAANFYIRVVFGITVRDANSGYRCFRRDALLAIDPSRLRSPGPAIVQEVLFRAHRVGLRVGEVPVAFVERAHGDSKLGWLQLWQGYTTVLRLRVRQLLGRES